MGCDCVEWLRSPGASCNFGQGRACAQGFGPAKRFRQGALQDRIGCGQRLTRDDPGLDPASAQGERRGDGDETGRDRLDRHSQGGCDRTFSEVEVQAPVLQGAGCDDRSEECWIGFDLFSKCRSSHVEACGIARVW